MNPHSGLFICPKAAEKISCNCQCLWYFLSVVTEFMLATFLQRDFCQQVTVHSIRGLSWQISSVQLYNSRQSSSNDAVDGLDYFQEFYDYDIILKTYNV